MKIQLRRIILALIILTILVQPCVASVAGESMSPQDRDKPPSLGLEKVQSMKFPPLDFKVPEVGVDVERLVLDNGMILYLKEDHSSPQVDIVGIIRTGSAYESRDYFGVAEITGSVMRTGGTKGLSPDQLNEKLDFMAASLETSIDTETGNIHLNVISSQLEPAFELMARVLREPAFNEREIELARSQIKLALIRRNEQASNIGQLEFYSRLYPDYSYSWEHDWEFVKSITRQDLIEWHQRFYHPDNMMFAVVGDFDRDEMIALFNRHFAQWPKKEKFPQRLQKVEFQFYPGVFFARKNISQSYIRMGHLGVRRNNPDRYAIEVMDYILGSGGFGSLLVERVRSDAGLAYSVGSYFNTEGDEIGTMGAVSSTRTDATIRATKLMMDTIGEIRTKKVSRERLDAAKDALTNSFLFKFQDPLSRTARLMMLEYYDLPMDYYQGCLQGYASVTADDVLRVAEKYIQPDKMTIIIVGDVDNFDEPLENLGYPVEEIILEEFRE